MQYHWVSLAVLASLSLGLAAVDARAVASDRVDPVGVLDRLSVQAPPAAGDRRDQLPLTADPVAVPTPTGAAAGMVLLAGLAGVRLARRCSGRCSVSA